MTKRHPQQRDLIERPYGRFHYLPVEMSALGHDVRVQLCSHRWLPSVAFRSSNVTWSSHDVLKGGLRAFWRSLYKEAETFRPDWIIGCSDAWIGCFAARLARLTGARLHLDAYDNFEAYMPWNLPLHALWRNALRRAHIVTAPGPQLASRLAQQRQAPVEVLPMAADPVFRPMDKAACRRGLGLPCEGPLVGYFGGWARNRGTDILVKAIRLVQMERPDVKLVLTGHPPSKVAAAPGVLVLGYVADAALPKVVNAVDVACVITANSAFGRYSYPAKLCESMACGVPVVATETAPVRWMLRRNTDHLAAVGDAGAIATRILENLRGVRVDYGELFSWKTVALQLDRLLIKRAAE